MAATGKTRMLSGCRVLDFTQYLAGPTVTRLMAEMGADIIKVELAPMGDPSRLLPTVKNGRSGYFVQQNRGKKSLCLDFNKPAALEVLRKLVSKVDIVVENFGPGVMEKRELDYESLSKLNPRIIMASLSAFGRKSPLAHKTGYDMIAQSFSGLMHMTGDPNGPPTFVGIGIADVGSGVHTFAALGYAFTIASALVSASTSTSQWSIRSTICTTSDCKVIQSAAANSYRREWGTITTRSARRGSTKGPRDGSSSWCSIVSGPTWSKRWADPNYATTRGSLPTRNGRRMPSSSMRSYGSGCCHFRAMRR
jgi:CoA-transferase family III